MKMAIKVNGQWHEVWGCLSHTIDHIVMPDSPSDIMIGDVPANMVKMTKNTTVIAGYTEIQLRAAFDLVKDKSNWKNPIRAIINATEDQAAVSAAIAYYCGSPCEFKIITTGPHKGKVKVTAPGYYACIGA